MTEPRVFLSLYLPVSIRDAVTAEAARRTVTTGTQISAARVMREAVVQALGLPMPDMPRGRRRKVEPQRIARHRTRPASPAAA